MKKRLMTAGALMLAVAATAQERHLPGFDKSVFRQVAAEGLNGNPDAVAKAQRKVQAAFPAWNAKIDATRGGFSDVYGPAIAIPGATVAERVDHVISQRLSAFGVVRSEWQSTRNQAINKAVYADFRQSFGGREVVFSRLSFRFTADGSKLVRVQLNAYPAPAPGLVPSLSTAQAAQAAAQDVSGAHVERTDVNAAWIWFPVPTDNGFALHPAYAYTIEGQDEKRNLPLLLTGYVDALTGEVLYRNNEVKETVDGTIKGNVYPHGLASPASLEPLPNLTITLGSAAVPTTTDSNGYFTNGTLNFPVTANIPLQGRWAKVITGNSTPTFSNTFSAPGQTYTYPATAPSSDRHVNAYYHVNIVHDFMKRHLPSFTGMDVVLATNVDVTGNCNAFYNGNSINFLTAGGGCNSFALIGDVVYHEYGHGITGRLYSSLGSNFVNGALNEGNSDIWALSITEDPILGQNAYVNGGFIRRYDGAPKVYPYDINGEVHADGEIIAGAWWDVALNMGSTDSMTRLFAASYYDLPNGPSGTEGDIYHQVLVSALMNDDDDNDLNNGTPHFVAIVDAFAKHGIYLLGDAIFNHTELAHQQPGQAITVNGTLVMTAPGIFQDMKMFYRVRGGATTPYDSVAMTNLGSLSFTAQIPAQPAGTIIDYYFRATDKYTTSDRVYFPIGFDPLVANQSTIPYQFGVGLSPMIVNNFETPATGWTLGNGPMDNATGGKWIQAVPMMSRVTQGLPPGTWLVVQTGEDHTTGLGQCLITGNASSPTASPDQADVDGGLTTALSPAIDVSSFTEPVIEYYRWYANNRSLNARSDAWRVQVCDANEQLWVTVENTFQADYNWRRRIFRLRELVPAFNGSFQMRFMATDNINTGLPNNGQNTVEAGIDDFVVYDKADNVGLDGAAPKAAGIYPNPADKLINILLAEMPAEGTIGIYDMSGRQLAGQSIKAGQQQYSINTAGLPAGSYFVMIRSGKSIQSHKVTVRH